MIIDQQLIISSKLNKIRFKKGTPNLLLIIELLFSGKINCSDVSKQNPNILQSVVRLLNFIYLDGSEHWPSNVCTHYLLQMWVYFFVIFVWNVTPKLWLYSHYQIQRNTNTNLLIYSYCNFLLIYNLCRILYANSNTFTKVKMLPTILPVIKCLWFKIYWFTYLVV